MSGFRLFEQWIFHSVFLEESFIPLLLLLCLWKLLVLSLLFVLFALLWPLMIDWSRGLGPDQVPSAGKFRRSNKKHTFQFIVCSINGWNVTCAFVRPLCCVYSRFEMMRCLFASPKFLRAILWNTFLIKFYSRPWMEFYSKMAACIAGLDREKRQIPMQRIKTSHR